MSRRLPNASSIFIIVLSLVTYFAVFADLDWSWQVRTGGDIVASGSLRLPDSFSYTIAGTPVHDFEWLYEVTLWAIWSLFDMGGLKLLRIILIVTPLLLVAWQLHREKVRWHGIALCIGLAIVILAPAWNLRPLYCTTIGLIVITAALHNHCKQAKPLSWGLVAAMLLWANLHPGVILGQALILGAISWEWLNRWLCWNQPLEAYWLRRLSVIGGVALAATLISPDPLDRLAYPFQPELAHPIMRIFTEMQPLYSLLAKPPFVLSLVYLVAALVGLTVILRFRQYRMWELALLLGLAFLANVAFRSTMDWLLIMLMLGGPHMKAVLGEAGRENRRRYWASSLLHVDRQVKKTLQSPLFRLQLGWLIAMCGVLLAISLVAPLARYMPDHEPIEWPRAALDYVENAEVSGRFFGPPDYGAYVGWRLKARGTVYADTRGFFFPPVLLEDSHFVPQLGPDWRRRIDRVLDEFKTDYFLLECTGPRGELWRQLRPHVGQPLFVDEHTVLFSADQVRQGLAILDSQSVAQGRGR